MILGLTGGIATGKSTASEFFRKNNFIIICADTIAKEVVESIDVLKKISDEFGEDMITNGKLNRTKMREFIFSEENRVKKLNEITHPPIIERIKTEIKKHSKSSLLIVDIPLLFEGNYEFLVDKVLLISTKKEIQLKRIQTRDSVSMENARNIINSQMSLEEKEKRADFVIENNGTPQEFYDKLDIFLKNQLGLF